jgi:hypothetical protein
LRRQVTICECDACPCQEMVESIKRPLLGYKMAPYPPNWQYAKIGEGDGDWLCPTCARGAQQAYMKYKQERGKKESGGKRK